MLRLSIAIVLSIAAALAARGTPVNSDIWPARLRCEYLQNPLGIDVLRPRLSWIARQAFSDTHDAVQTAYQVLVATSRDRLTIAKADLWVGPRTESDRMSQIEYEGKALQPHQECWWTVRIWDGAGRPSRWAAPQRWSMGPLSAENWGGAWIEDPTEAPGGEALPAPMLRREFSVRGRVRRAIVYVSALGLVELHLNGKRVGDNLLAPEWTDYGIRVQYQAHDVTRLVREGSNALGALLGDGWYAGRIGLFPGRAHYGRKPRLRLHLRIEMEDGSVQTIVSDAKWRSTLEGPIRSADILDGETIDARRAMPGWDQPGFDDGSWKQAGAVEAASPALVWQRNEPIRVVQELKPVAVTHPKPGITVYDLGQNMVGWVRLRLSGPAGGEVQVRHAEMLNDDGTIYTANLRGAAQTDRYTLAGQSSEVFEPHFTYHGFRYVEVSGALRKPSLRDLTGRVFCSSSPETGNFQCSSMLLTKLARNAFWTQRANLMSTPTDCPQRDERLGWMGDIQSFSQSAIFNMDVAGFFTKWLQDVRDAQLADGRMPDFAPNPGKAQGSFSGVPAWGDAGVIVPWRAWVNYGDRRILEASYPSCRRWLDYIRRLNPDLLWRNGRNNDYNDWLNGDTLILEGWPRTGGAVPNEVFATAFFAHSTDLTRRMAEALGRTADAAELAQWFADIKTAFNRAYVKPDGEILGDTQAGYALALHFDLLPEDVRPKAVERLVAAIHRYRDHLSTGIQSTHRLMLELTRWNQADLAYTLANRTDFPSWGFMIQNGATTIWERWDGYVKGRGFQDPGMNSFNHWALGSVVEWLWRSVVGLSPDESAPGWRRFHVRPMPGGGLTWARGEYHSPAGFIAVSWQALAGKLHVALIVPPNTQAILTLPGSAPQTVGSGEHEFIVPFGDTE